MHHIIGAGSVGTVLAGHLLAAGQSVRLQVRPGRADDYRAAERLQIIDAENETLIDQAPPPITTQFDGEATQCIFITVKHPQLPAVLEQLAGRVDERTTLAPCLNGVGLARRLQEHFPNNPIAAVTVMFNARVESDLRARLTTRAEILIDSDNPDLLHAFDGSGMRVHRADAATEWGKLLINLNNAVCALTGTGFADLFSNRYLARAFVLVLDEAIATLDAAGIEYSLPAPVPYRLYRAALLHVRWLPLLVARRKNGLSDQAYPSMLADLQRGHNTEIDALNGVIVELGREQGVSTPANRKLVDLVHAREGGAATDALTPLQLIRTLEDS